MIFYNLNYNPFIKKNSEKFIFKSSDFNEVNTRLEYLINLKGIGLITGDSGSGKTYSINQFRKNLNPSLFKVIYIQTSTLSSYEFYKSLSYGLGLEPKFKKIDMFREIQDTIKSFVNTKKINIVIILDEAQYLKPVILHELKLILNFDMDSANYASLVLVGLPIIKSALNRISHEPLRQRIIVNYTTNGLSLDETCIYVSQTLKLAGNPNTIFTDDALQAAHSISNGSIRKLNLILEKALIIGSTDKLMNIDSETIRQSQVEIEL